MIKLVAIIPHYRHIDTLPSVIEALRHYQLPIVVVDDGSGESYFTALEKIKADDVTLLTQTPNQGKGSAVKYGIKWAAANGYTHALQIDADGQHDISHLSTFIATAQARPEAVICARPVYQQDAPKSRLHGRKINNFWNIIHTWSRDIKDGMIGLRIYPIASSLTVIENQYLGDRMDFDNEMLIHLYWQRQPLIWIDTPIYYHRDGISHFHNWRDNWQISKMHTRLFFQMLWRRISLLFNRLK